jgi:hypothetical protein
MYPQSTGTAFATPVGNAPMAAHQSLHDILRPELTRLAGIVRRLQIASILLDVAKYRGYSDLFEALQLTPEPGQKESNNTTTENH